MAQSKPLRTYLGSHLFTHTFSGQALSSKWLTSTCAHTFVSNYIFCVSRMGKLAIEIIS